MNKQIIISLSKHVIRIVFTLGAAVSTMYIFYTQKISTLKKSNELHFNDPENLYVFYTQYKEQVTTIYLSLILNYLLMIFIGVLSGWIMYSVITGNQSETKNKTEKCE